MSVADLIMWGTVGGGSGIGALGYVWLNKALSTKKATGPVLIDGRTHEEWYDVLKSIGKEEYEKLARPALDGLEEKPEHGWDVKMLLGGGLHNRLMQEWYPERYPRDFCVYCGKSTCKKDCNAYWAGKPSKIHPNRCTCNVCASIVLGSKISTGRGYTPGRPGPRPRPQTKIPSAPPLGKGVDVTRIEFHDGSGRSNCYRISYGNKSWIADQDDVGRFQIHKGLRPTGTIDTTTRNVLNSYLLAGNPWPVEHPTIRKPENELERIMKELLKWEKDLS